MDRTTDSSRRPSVSLPGIRTLFPGIIWAMHLIPASAHLLH